MTNTIRLPARRNWLIIAISAWCLPMIPSVGQTVFPGAVLQNADPPFLTGITVNHQNRIYRSGDLMQVEFEAEQAAYLYLLYHQANGDTVLLFPNQGRQDNHIPARRAVRIPQAEDRFHFRTSAPFGDEALQVLAARAPIAELDHLLATADNPTPNVSTSLLAALAKRLKAEPNLWSEYAVSIQTRSEATVAPKREAARLGLFIGIGKYARDDICATHTELRHSAELMYQLMIDRGQLDPERTRLVTDQHATKSNLRRLITEWLPSVSQPGDTVFVYFSGHSGQIQNEDGSEPDGYDETLCAYDIDNGDPSMPYQQRMERYKQTRILDDTFARWLMDLSGRQVVVILDTCFSGGLVDANPAKQLPARLLGDELKRTKDLIQLNSLVLTATGPDQQATFEGTPNQTMWFTYFLTQAIANQQPLTVKQSHAMCVQGIREVFERLGESRIQEPTISDNVLLPIYLVP